MTIRLVIATQLLAALAACSGIAVDADYDPAVDFDSLRSYSWIDGVPPQTAELVQGSFLVLRVRAAADPWLEQSGYRLSLESEVDFLVRQQVITRERVEAWTSSYGSARAIHGGMGYRSIPTRALRSTPSRFSFWTSWLQTASACFGVGLANSTAWVPIRRMSVASASVKPSRRFLRSSRPRAVNPSSWFAGLSQPTPANSSRRAFS